MANQENNASSSGKGFLYTIAPVLAVMSAIISAIVSGYVTVHTKDMEGKAQAAVTRTQQEAQQAIAAQNAGAQLAISEKQNNAQEKISEKQRDTERYVSDTKTQTDAKIAELREKTATAIAEQENSVQKGELFAKLISDVASADAHKSSVALLVLWQVYPSKDFVIATALAVNNETIIPTLRLLGADPTGRHLLQRYRTIGTPQQKAAAQAALGEINFVGDIQNPELKRRLEELLRQFQKYLQNLGFANVSSDTEVVFAHEEEAFYYPDQRKLVIGIRVADDANTVLRQYAHHVLAMPESNRDKSLSAYFAVESGLASYYACSFTGHGVLGDRAIAQDLRFDLNNARKIEEIRLGRNDWVSVQNDGSEIWGGVFWQIRGLLSKQNTDILLFKAWSSMQFTDHGDDAMAAYHDFLTKLDKQGDSMGLGNHRSQIREILERRGL